MEYQKPDLLTSYHVADLYESASAFSSGCLDGDSPCNDPYGG